MPLPSVIVNVRDRSEAVLVPGGRFYIGMDEDRVLELVKSLGEELDPVFKTEKPRQVVLIKDCYIDRHPVTNRQYTEFLKVSGRKPPQFLNDPRWNQPNLPVVGISYRDAEAYCQWAGKRLPTEEEWELAARGTDERIFPWGNEFDSQRCNSKEWMADRTTEVTLFPGGVSPVGALDMAGNVWELTSGNWENFGKAIRGGSYKNSAAYCRCTCRWGIDPDLTGSTWLGFRGAIDLAKARIYGKAKP